MTPAAVSGHYNQNTTQLNPADSTANDSGFTRLNSVNAQTPPSSMLRNQPLPMAAPAKANQEVHGGQDWRNLKTQVYEMSTTTNSGVANQQNFDRSCARLTAQNIIPALAAQLPAADQAVLQRAALLLNVFANTSTPAPLQNAMHAYLNAARNEFDHYPDSQKEPALTQVASGFWGAEKAEQFKPLLVIGNGASEVIDLTIRIAKNKLDEHGVAAPTWRPGRPVQYREYERSAQFSGFKQVDSTEKSADFMAIVNPNNPVGEYDQPEKILQDLHQLKPGSFVIIDESGNGWNPNYDAESFTHKRGELKQLSEQKDVHVFVISSWTKLFACLGGARVGTCIAPTEKLAQDIKNAQVPWSVSTPALAFFGEAMQEGNFKQITCEKTQAWNESFKANLSEILPRAEILSNAFLPYHWIDVKDESLAKAICRENLVEGTPIRSGEPGYQQETCIRVKSVAPELAKHFFNAVERAIASEKLATPETVQEIKDSISTAKNDASESSYRQTHPRSVLELRQAAGKAFSKGLPDLAKSTLQDAMNIIEKDNIKLSKVTDPEDGKVEYRQNLALLASVKQDLAQGKFIQA